MLPRTRLSRKQPRRRFAHVNIRVESDDDRAKILALEDSFGEEGVEFDTGWNIDDGSRDWELDESLTGQLSATKIIGHLGRDGLKFAVTWRKPRKKKSKKPGYREGDIVSLPVDNQGSRGYGRVLIEKSPLIFVEFFEITRKENPSIEVFRDLESIVSIYTTDQGIEEKTWKVLGNIPITQAVSLPQFWWSYDDLSERLLLFTDHRADYRTGRETTIEEIRRLRANPMAYSATWPQRSVWRRN